MGFKPRSAPAHLRGVSLQGADLHRVPLLLCVEDDALPAHQLQCGLVRQEEGEDQADSVDQEASYPPPSEGLDGTEDLQGPEDQSLDGVEDPEEEAH